MPKFVVWESDCGHTPLFRTQVLESLRVDKEAREMAGKHKVAEWLENMAQNHELRKM